MSRRSTLLSIPVAVICPFSLLSCSSPHTEMNDREKTPYSRLAPEPKLQIGVVEGSLRPARRKAVR